MHAIEHNLGRNLSMGKMNAPARSARPKESSRRKNDTTAMNEATSRSQFTRILCLDGKSRAMINDKMTK